MTVEPNLEEVQKGLKEKRKKRKAAKNWDRGQLIESKENNKTPIGVNAEVIA